MADEVIREGKSGPSHGRADGDVLSGHCWRCGCKFRCLVADADWWQDSAFFRPCPTCDKPVIMNPEILASRLAEAVASRPFPVLAVFVLTSVPWVSLVLLSVLFRIL